MGVKAGLNLSDIVMTNYVNPDVESDLRIKAGLHAGFFAAGELRDRLGMSAEVQYSNKGVRGNTNINLHYIAVPLMAQYALGEKTYAELGPELAYMVAATSPFGNASSTYNNKLDLALNGGIGFDLSPWIITVRYSAGLFSVRDPFTVTGISGAEKVRYQNRVVQFSLGYRLWELLNGKK